MREWISRRNIIEDLRQRCQELQAANDNITVENDSLNRIIQDLRSEQEHSIAALDRATMLSDENARLKAQLFAQSLRNIDSSDTNIDFATAGELLSFFIQERQTLPAIMLLTDRTLISELSRADLRILLPQLRLYGYWDLLLLAWTELARRTKKNFDNNERQKVEARLNVFRNPIGEVSPETESIRNTSGPVIHVVGKSPLTTQSGYTIRTSYLVQSQLKLGIPSIVAVQPGSNKKSSSETVVSVVNGVEYHSLAGGPRTKAKLDTWLADFTKSLEELVKTERPSILHAHSDFLNAAAAISVGRKLGVPIIYETRGFWEESWLSRLTDAFNLGSEPEQLLSPIGLPEAYKLRKEAEAQVRSRADAVVTLSHVMKEHIQELSSSDLLPPVHVLPNAVNSAAFTPQKEDANLQSNLGIEKDDFVFGYIGSIVEYEGIDLLLRAFKSFALKGSSKNSKLLLVGEGLVLDRLKTLAKELEISERVIFTGRIRHSKIRDYYSLIDVIVIPRRSSAVSELVTPLKPFEAMAMGKPVIVSNVNALAEIANDSQALVQFTANDPEHLAEALSKLASDQRLRETLSSKAREWVQNHRSWDKNAEKSLEIYESLGAIWSKESIADTKATNEKVRNYIVENSPPLTGWFVVNQPKDDFQTLIADGWQYRNFDRVKLDTRIEWNKYPEIDRSLAFWLQAWSFIDAFYASNRVPSLEETRLLVSVAKQWNENRIENNERFEPDKAMTYYDMSLALRAPRILALIWTVLQYEETLKETEWLIPVLLNERQMLRETSAFTPHTNHGFYTAASQLHLEKYLPELPDHDRVQSQATHRMNRLVKSQFAADGGHREHSPAYHQLLLESFSNASKTGLFADETGIEYLERATAVMGWMIQPDGNLVSFGDSTPTQVPLESLASQDPHTRWIISDGELGTPITDEIKVLPESGYVFIRSPQPQATGHRLKSSYLAFQGGFHSRAHKHADDLSIVWFDRRNEILIDAGRWSYGPLLASHSPLRQQGFYYAAPERQYVESGPAHNTVEVDERIQDRKRKPFGSAIVNASKDDGAFRIQAIAPHNTYEHERTLQFVPGKSLTVNDLVTFVDEDDHHVDVWFLLNPDLQLQSWTYNEAIFLTPDGERLHMTTSGELQVPVKGQHEPLRGWRSVEVGKLVPAWSLRITHVGCTQASIETTFVFND